MNNNYKIVIALPFILGALTGCNSDSEDASIITSQNYITTAYIEEEVAEEAEPSTETNDGSIVNKLLNEDFENWTDDVPDSWPTIEEGITVTKNTETFHSGLASAEVTVNTGSQGITDFRQSIEVTSGTTYTFSAWFYHTEGALKVTLYADGYPNEYSDFNLVNQWQEITYNYTANEDKIIEVGFRFYDETGFDGEETVYLDDLSFSVTTETEESTTETSTGDGSTTSEGSSSVTTTNYVDTTTYYSSADNLTGLELKTALYNIIKDHTTKTYGNLWDFMGENSLDTYYENDGSILDMYSENPSSSDTYNYTAITDQCGNYSGEGSCYNREHSFPKSWFDDATPMYTDIHHIFATDGYVNGRRSNYPYGEVDTSTFVSDNGSKLGSATSSLGYTGTVFEPIDEFKGDFARAYFYMATRYEDIISTWENNSDNADAVLDGTSDYVYEEWVITMLKEWNENDPVSQKELDRNEAAYEFQGNRNPFIDHPEYINQIWAD